MNPVEFEALAWSVILEEATPEETAKLQRQCAHDEFQRTRFEHMRREHDSFGESLRLLHKSRVPAVAPEIPPEVLTALMREVEHLAPNQGATVGTRTNLMAPPIEIAPAVRVAASAAPDKPAKTPSPQKAGWGWLGGLAAAGILGLLRFLSHEAGPLMKVAGESTSKVAVHSSASLAHTAAEVGTKATDRGLGAAARETERYLDRGAAMLPKPDIEPLPAPGGTGPYADLWVPKGPATGEPATVVREAPGGGMPTAAGATAAIAAASPLLATEVAGKATSETSSVALGFSYTLATEFPRLAKIAPGGAAQVAGLQVGDFLLEANGVSLRNVNSDRFNELLAAFAGDQIVFNYIRSEIRGETTVTPPHRDASEKSRP